MLAMATSAYKPPYVHASLVKATKNKMYMLATEIGTVASLNQR